MAQLPVGKKAEECEPMIKYIGWGLFFGCSLYTFLCCYLYATQRSILYYPTPPSTSSNTPSFTFTNDDQILHVYKVERKTRNAVIYFGGNAEDVSQSTDHLAALFPNRSIYLPCYRGYGNSSGQPSEKALVDDALALYNRVEKDFDDITLFGRSLGSGVAIQLAAQHSPNRVILATPYDSMAAVARHHYPFFPVNMLLQDRFDSLSRANLIQVPTLLLIAEHDEVIPRENSERLGTALSAEITDIKVITGTNHNSIHLSPDYNMAIETFLHTPDI
jgi:uncharacterized protein